jgi:hypothetical protein
VKTENPSACVTVKCKVCKSAIALKLPVDPSTVCKMSVNPIIHSRTHLQVTRNPLHVAVFTRIYGESG